MIEKASESPSRDPSIANGHIRFGARSFRLAAIRSYRIERIERPGLAGNLASFSLFVLLASVMIELVVAQIAGPKFMAGAAVLALGGLVGLQDGWLERGTALYRLVIVLSDGPHEACASTKAVEIAAAARKLAEARNAS